MATFKALRWQILLPVFPRIILIAFTFGQPLLMRRLLGFLQEPVDSHTNQVGRLIIGAYCESPGVNYLCTMEVTNTCRRRVLGSCGMPPFHLHCVLLKLISLEYRYPQAPTGVLHIDLWPWFAAVLSPQSTGKLFK